MTDDVADLMANVDGKATFHEAWMHIIAIRNLLNECNDYSRRGDFLNWKRTLDNVYRELIFVMKPKEREDKDALVRDKVLPALKGITGVQKGGNTASFRQAGDTAYTVLCEYEIYLRDIQGKYGLVMPHSSDPGQAFKKGRG